MPLSWSTLWTSPACAAWVPCSLCCTRPVVMLHFTITTTPTFQCPSTSWKNTCRWCRPFQFYFFKNVHGETRALLMLFCFLIAEISDLCCTVVLLRWRAAENEGWTWRIYPADYHCTPSCCSQCPHHWLWGTVKFIICVLLLYSRTIILISLDCFFFFLIRCASPVSGSPGKAKCHRLRLRLIKWHPLMLWFPPWTLFVTRLCCTHGWQSTSHWCFVDLLALEKPWLCSVHWEHYLTWRLDLKMRA